MRSLTPVFQHLIGHGSYRELSAMYPAYKHALAEALASGAPFDTGWWSSKDDIWQGRVSRIDEGGALLLEVSHDVETTTHIDYMFQAVGGSLGLEARSGRALLYSLGLDEKGAQAAFDAAAAVVTFTNIHLRAAFDVDSLEAVLDVLDDMRVSCMSAEEDRAELLFAHCVTALNAIRAKTG